MKLTHWDLWYLLGKTPWQRGEPPKELVKLVESGRIRPGKALDLGCGTGVLARYLASKGFDVLGVDISKVAIIKAKFSSIGIKRKPKFRATDIHLLQVEEPFDLVTDVGCYHSQPEELRARYPFLLRERLLKVGGNFLLWCRAPDDKYQGFGPHPIERDELEEYFKKEGFEILELRKLEGRKWPKFFVWFQLTRR